MKKTETIDSETTRCTQSILKTPRQIQKMPFNQAKKQLSIFIGVTAMFDVTCSLRSRLSAR